MKNTFSRRIGRSLRLVQKELLDNFLPTISITGQADLVGLKEQYGVTNLEIGIGNGEFFVHNAISSPQELFIGCEPYLNCVATAARNIKSKEISNARIFADDARVLLSFAPLNYFCCIYIICPDPWPKRRQHDRRLINESFLQLLNSKLAKPEGKLVIVTDHFDYAKWIFAALQNSKCYQLPYNDLEGYKNLPEEWLYTKYQRRGLEKNHSIYYFQGYVI